MTAAVSIRGLLQQADVDLSSIAWAEGALEKPGSHGVSSAKPLLKRVKRVSLSLLSADLPPCFHTCPHVKRLFPDFKSAEKTYFRGTGIFPIVHLLAIQRKMLFFGELRYMLPWLPAELDGIDEVFQISRGGPSVYGLEENRKILEALVGFLEKRGMIEEGLSK
ncbi:MAG: hypothetical protein LQ340_000658 [Diploschistes diacapsis]|nr:MAG: hypothetical protein LQ340_000658 [Diploschistes diacapsis]